MDSDCQMFLIVNDDRHRLKHGITLLGSTDNDRYSVIRMDEKSVCAKHAAVRCNPTTQELHIMDLCSHSGTTLAVSPSATSAKELTPLEWHAVPNGGRITIGTTIQCRVEIGSLLGGGGARRSTRLGSASFFEDSADFIDCSLEEPSSLKSRSNLQQTGASNTLTVSNAQAGETSLQRDSFVVPATQPVKAAASTSLSSSAKVNESQNGGGAVIGAGPEDDLDDDDLFYIPETQECNEDAPNASQAIDPIGNTIGTGDKEDDFLCFESQDERNTGDGLFNNPYVELASQNLLQNLDESYKMSERKSIAPDRSSDSISFQGKLPEADPKAAAATDETDEDLSKLEWNETKNTTKGTEPRDGSVTPELMFGKPSGEEPRVESVTPDLDFDRVTPQHEPVKLASTSKLSLSKKVEEPPPPQDRTESVTPDLDFEKRKEGDEDEDEAEILPNQEAFNRSECQVDPYELATQVMVPDGGEEKEDDPYLLATQALPQEREPHSTSVYDLATQMEPSSSKVNPSSAFKVPAAPKPKDDDDENEDDIYDLATQQLPQEKVAKARSLRKLNIKLTNWATSRSLDVSLHANKEFELGAFDVATQPLPAGDKDDAYDLATQALPQANRGGLPGDESDEENDTIPLALPEDAYELQTQPLVAKDSRGSLVDEDDPEVTRNFRPAVNSTCRPSMIGRQMEEDKGEDDLNISPSSNKENRSEVNSKGGKKGAASSSSRTAKRLVSTQDDLLGFTEPTETEDLDDEYCLAETMPVATEEKDRSKKPVFKVPENRSAASSTKSSRTGGSGSSSSSALETPSRSKPDTDTCSFEFNTPEHPFLNMAKKETILAVSDMIKSQQPKALDRLARKNKYIFGDSSDEDQDPNEPVFKKQDSKLQVMKYDREEPKAEEPAVAPAAAAERRSARDKKKSKRYSEDGEDDDTSSKASTSSSKSKASTSTRSAPKKQVDESVDYQPSVTVSELKSTTTRSRKRKAAEEPPSAPAEPKPSKSSKSAAVEEPTKTRGRSKRAVVELPPPPPPKVQEPKQEPKQKVETKQEPKPERTTSKRTKQKQPSVSEDDGGESTSEANTSTASAESSSSSGTRKSTRAAKPRLMFTKMSPEPYKRIITRAGGTIVDLPELASILVSDRVYRTYKFLCAMARGIPIVGQPYLEEVQRRRELIDPWDYILADAEMERRFKFDLKKSLRAASEAKIFQDYSMFVTPSTKPPPEELQLIMASAGGRVIKFPAQQPKHADKVFVVSHVDDKQMWPKMREQYPSITIISTEGFMQSVMQHYKHFRNYRLT
uniref:Mediator of DNA damage checkpoint protein 1 n=1 Tax=Culex tarsalis TaxID=7177 RepID=A0A1Q3G150_CULTA